MTLDQLKGRCRLEDGHWIWTGAKSDGWPRIWAPDHTNHGGEYSTQTGRRAAWHLKTGKPIKDGWRVFGTCERRDCVSPIHMDCKQVATQGAAVAASGKLKGQITRIKANRATGRSRSHLSPELIAEIKVSPETGTALAARLNLSRATVSRVRQGKALAFEAVGGMFSGLLAANDNTRRAA